MSIYQLDFVNSFHDRRLITVLRADCHVDHRQAFRASDRSRTRVGHGPSAAEIPA